MTGGDFVFWREWIEGALSVLGLVAILIAGAIVARRQR